MNRGTYPKTFDEDVPLAEQSTDAGCPECGGHVRTNARETACEDCGLVLEDERIDHGPEWSAFDEHEDDPRRTGAPLTHTRHDNGLSTKVGHGQQDANGNRISSDKRRRLARMRTQHGRALRGSKREQNQMYGLMEIRRMTGALGLSDALQGQASQLFRTAQGADLLRGRSIEAISAAAVYAACRCNGLPQTLDDVGRVARVPRRKVKHGYKVLNRELDIPARPRRPTSYLPRFISELGLSSRVERRARDLLDAVDDRSLGSGANPASLAGGAVLVAAEEVGERQRFRQTDLAEVAGVTPVTLRTHRERFRDLV